MQFHNLIVVADEFTTSDRPFALARRLAAAGNLSVQVVYGELDDGTRDGTPGWRLQRRLDAHGLSAATLSVVRSHEPELAVSEHLAGHEGSLVLRGTSAGGHDGGPLLDRVAETIMRQLAHPLLLLGPRQVNPRRDDQLSPITVRDGVSELTSLLAATESWTETFTNIHAELVDVLPPDPWPRTDVDNLERHEAVRARTSPSSGRSTSAPPSCRISTVAMTPSSWSPVHDGLRRRRTGGPRRADSCDSCRARCSSCRSSTSPT